MRAFETASNGVVTSLVPQTSARVLEVIPVHPNALASQLGAVTSERSFQAWKVGLIPRAELVEVVIDAHDGCGRPPLVLDPVLWAGDGTSLVEESAHRALRRLARRARMLTPNLAEARALAESDAPAADLCRELAPEDGWCVVTGGDSATGSVVVDWLSDGGDALPFERPLVEVGWVRGTGCALSSAIAALMAGGTPPAEAVEQAGNWVAGQLELATRGGDGGGRLP